MGIAALAWHVENVGTDLIRDPCLTLSPISSVKAENRK